MTLWIDADACPGEIRSVLFRAAIRRRLKLVLVACSPIAIPPGGDFALELVPPGADSADDRIVERCQVGDLVVTADIPLAARVVEKGATALNPRGELYTAANVGQALSMRNFMEEMRSGGLVQGGPAEHHARDTQKFANALDRFLVRARLGNKEPGEQS